MKVERFFFASHLIGNSKLSFGAFIMRKGVRPFLYSHSLSFVSNDKACVCNIVLVFVKNIKYRFEIIY